VSGAGSALKGIEQGIKCWGWLKKKVWGEVEINSPPILRSMIFPLLSSSLVG
jgi:hypothetical protein